MFRVQILKLGHIVVEGSISKVEVEDLQQLPLELELKMYKLVKQNIAWTQIHQITLSKAQWLMEISWQDQSMISFKRPLLPGDSTPKGTNLKY